MKEIQSNINIIGGGLIGAVTAYSLSKLGNKVVVLEQNAKFDHKNIYYVKMKEFYYII